MSLKYSKMDRNNVPPAVTNAIIFRKFIPITIVVLLTLIQGVLGIGCLYIAYISYNCNPTTIDLGMILYFKYFGGNDCESIATSSSRSSTQTDAAEVNRFLRTVMAPIGDATQSLKGSLSDTSTSITLVEFNKYLPDVVGVAKRVQIELILYGVISLLWIITSLLTLVSCLCKYIGKIPFFVCFVPWFVAIITGCVLDFVATVFHIFDISNTRTLPKTLEYFGIENTGPLLEVKNFSLDYLHMPIIVTCLTSKLVILWLVNLFGSFLVIRQSKQIVWKRRLSAFVNDFQYQKQNVHGDAANRNLSSGVQAEGAVITATQQPHGNTTIEISGRFDVQSISLTRHDSMLSEQPQDAGKGHRDEMIQTESNCDCDSVSRFSGNSSVSRVQSIKEKLHLTDELRSQLPWSYLNARNDIGTSIRVLAHHEHKDVPPSVPVPDYQVDYRRQERPISQGSRTAHRLSGHHHSQKMP